MRLFWTPEALDDRRAIYDYIEADNPLAALNLDELFSEKVRNLIDHPWTWADWPSHRDARAGGP